MRKNAALANRAVESGYRNGRNAASTLHRPAAYSLVIPKCAPALPSKYTSFGADALWARVALEWIDAGEAPEEGWSELPVEMIVQKIISRWFSSHLGDLEHLSISSLEVTSDPRLLDWCYGSGDHGAEFLTGKDGFWSFGISCEDYPNWLDLKPKVEELEAKHPGLGETALHLLLSASNKTVPVWTPNYARYLSQYLYWQGNDEMSEFLKEMEMQGEDVDEDGWITPDSFDAAYPGHVHGPDAKLNQQTLRGLADSSDEQSSMVAKILLEVMGLLEKGAALPDHLINCEAAGMAAVFTWGSDDQYVSQIIDDHMEQANQCVEHYSLLSGVTSIPIDDATTFKAWKETTEMGIALLKQLDLLIGLITVPVFPKE